jgi:two-component system, OmpR family, sensor histidine kinase MprB
MHRSPSNNRGGVNVFNRLSLRGRFALLAAVAVSVAVVGAALASYFLVAQQLNDQVNGQLTRQVGFTGPRFGEADHVTSGGVPTAQTAHDQYDACVLHQIPGQVPNPSQGTSQANGGTGSPVFGGAFSSGIISSATGTACWSLGNGLQTTMSATQLAIAKGTINTANGGVSYETYTSSGEHVRVYTIAALGTPGYAYTSIASLSTMDSSLNKLTIELGFAAVGGILLATIAGLVVARSAVKPVRRLTRAVEHVAKTEDLSVKLPVEGKDEINRLGAAFNKMTKALATSRDRQRQLIADAGHELRTPLTSLRTNVDLLLRSERTGRELPPGRRETMLVSVDQQLHELSGLVTDLLELSRSQEGGPRRTMRVALHESVGRAVERAKLRGPGLHFDVKIEPWFVQGDPTAVDRAVVNLLDNAVKFSPAAGTVTVRLNAGEYTVTDQGPGIDPADLPHVFERFWRSDSARSLPGSGLGLAIVSQVADESGGKVGLYPAPGGGTAAHLFLPGEPGEAEMAGF